MNLLDLTLRLDLQPDTAVIVVDVLNDFGHPDGSLFVNGAPEALPAINQVIAAATAAGATMVFTREGHPPVTPHFAKDGGIWPDHGVAGTWGDEFVDGLDITADALVIAKGAAGDDGYSAFFTLHPITREKRDTGLDAALRAKGVKRIVVIGYATDWCVKATGLNGRELGYEVIVYAPATAAVNLNTADEGQQALIEMDAAGIHVIGTYAKAA